MKNKILLFIFGFISSAALLLIILAAASVFIFQLSFGDVFTKPVLYLVWGLLIVGGITAMILDHRFRGAKRVLKVNIDLENSHWLTKREIEDNDGFIVTRFEDLGQKPDGIPLCAEVHRNQMNVTLVKPIHTLVIGATDTGKTSAFVSPAIEILSRTKSKPCMVITDPKGELYKQHAESLKKQGYNVHVIDLADVYHSTQWNPFHDVVKKTLKVKNAKVEQIRGKYLFDDVFHNTYEDAMQAMKEEKARINDEIFVDLQDLIYTMCPIENKQESSWEKGARDFILAITVAHWEDVRDGYMLPEQLTLYNLYRAVCDYAKGECIEFREYMQTREEESKARGLANTVLVSMDRTMASYLADVNQYFSWLADNGVAVLTSGNEIEFDNFDEAANVLFLKIPDEKVNRHRLIALFVTQVYKALVEKASKNLRLGHQDSQRLLRNIYFIMDEFGNMPPFYNIDVMATVGRGRGIFLIPVIQDFNQLDKIYGKEKSKILQSACNIQIFIGTNDKSTRELFSELCGKKKVKNVTFNDNREMSVNTSAQSIPLIFPSELERLNDPANKVFGNVIVARLGNYPMKSKFTPYFQAGDFYGAEDAKMNSREFVDFQPSAVYYDIAKVTTFLSTYEELINATPTAQNSITTQKNKKERKSELDRDQIRQEVIQKMLIDLKRAIQKVNGRISDIAYKKLLAADPREKMSLLDEEIDLAMLAGDNFLMFELAKLKEYILRRCFTETQINQYKGAAL